MYYTTGTSLIVTKKTAKLALGMTCWAVGLVASGVASEPSAQSQYARPVAPPSDAIVLLAPDGIHGFVSMEGKEIDWPAENGTLVSQGRAKGKSTNHIVSKYHFRDAHLHAEFMLPAEGTGNSGIYVHGNYELQIFRSDADGDAEPTDKEMGAVYGFHPLLVKAARPAGEWQVYDIEYTAPRRDSEGKLIQEGSISAWLNGQMVQDHARLGEPRSVYHPFRYGSTPYLQEIWKEQKRTSVGPVFLQDHANPVRFRNVWVKPLDSQAHFYESDNTEAVSESR